jgi:hypothetical protein
MFEKLKKLGFSDTTAMHFMQPLNQPWEVISTPEEGDQASMQCMQSLSQPWEVVSAPEEDQARRQYIQRLSQPWEEVVPMLEETDVRLDLFHLE